MNNQDSTACRWIASRLPSYKALLEATICKTIQSIFSMAKRRVSMSSIRMSFILQSQAVGISGLQEQTRTNNINLWA